MAHPQTQTRSGEQRTSLRPDAVAALRAAGMRVTQPRVEVLHVLRDHPHSSALSVLQMVPERLNSVSTQTVYDVLHALTDTGLVRRIEPMGSVSRYEVCTGDQHHHVVCRTCGEVADVARVAADRSFLTLPSTDFTIEEAEVTFWGLCPQCSTTTPSNNNFRENHV